MITNEFRKNLISNSLADIKGQQKVKNALKSALLSNRHIVIVGPPGVGKTTLAKNVAKFLPEIELNDCPYNCSRENPICPQCIANAANTANKNQKQDTKNKSTKKVGGEQLFVRIQGSPDLAIEDLIGDIDPVKALKFGPTSPEAFSLGKIFKANNGILFFDELNRCPEKVQNALLQVLSEGKATIGTSVVDINADFIFIATMNPFDSSTEKLSDVLLDRFDVIQMGYPETQKIEEEIVLGKGQKIEKIEIKPEFISFIVNFVRELRENKKLEKLPSVRASIGLYERAQANALLDSRNSVTMQDIQDAVASVIPHRIKLKPSVQYLQSAEEFVKEEYKKFSEAFQKIGGFR